MVESSLYSTLLEGTITWSCRLFVTAGGLCGFALTLLYMFQDKLLYVPQLPGLPKEPNYTPDMWNILFEDVWLQAADGVNLHAWFLWLPGWSEAYRKTRPVVMFFQENAGNMGFRLPFLKRVMKELQCPVFALSYRGYGFSAGRPSQKGIVLDATAALDHVRQRSDVDASRVVLFGRSLGGAVAIYTAAQNQTKVCALIVENTFTSVEDMSGVVVPPLGLILGEGKPFNFIVRNKWHNLETIAKVTDLPVLLMVSMKDEMVPPSHMLRLRSAVPPSHCTWVEFPNSRHMDAYDTAPSIYWPGLVRFFQQHVEDASTRANKVLDTSNGGVDASLTSNGRVHKAAASTGGVEKSAVSTVLLESLVQGLDFDSVQGKKKN